MIEDMTKEQLIEIVKKLKARIENMKADAIEDWGLLESCKAIMNSQTKDIEKLQAKAALEKQEQKI